jgi:hypothetical protein
VASTARWNGVGGDSLHGRYHLLRLRALSVAELRLDSASDFEMLLTCFDLSH